MLTTTATLRAIVCALWATLRALGHLLWTHRATIWHDLMVPNTSRDRPSHGRMGGTR